MSDWWKFDRDLPELGAPVGLLELEPPPAPRLVLKPRVCLVCGAPRSTAHPLAPLPFCDVHLVERDQVIVEVQALEKVAFDAMHAIRALAEKHPAYTPFTAANALVHLSTTAQQIERCLLDRDRRADVEFSDYSDAPARARRSKARG